MTKTFITNDCLAIFLYKQLDIEYQSPFIGSLFEDDMQYLRFCKNFSEYMKYEPRIAPPLLPVTFLGVHDSPVMFLGDIEIHWPHETEGPEQAIGKFKRRLSRMSEAPTFIWSDMQIFNAHSEEELQKMKADFKAIPNSIFIEKDEIEEHKKESLADRTSIKFFNTVRWLDYKGMAAHILKA